MNTKRRLGILTAVALTGWLLAGQNAHAEQLRLVRSLDFPDNFISRSPNGLGVAGTGIAWDGEYLYLSGVASPFGHPGEGSYGTGIYQMDPISGDIVKAVIERGLPIFSATVWDGNDLWASHAMGFTDLDGNIHWSHTLQRIAKTDGSVLWSQAFRNSNVTAKGLAWDGQHLWLSDSVGKTIQQLDPNDLTVLGSFPSPAETPRGLTWDGQSLWGVDASDNTVFQMDTAGNLLGRWSTPGTSPYGITFDGQYLWVVDNDRRTIDQLAIPEPSTLALLLTGLGVLMAYRMRHNARRSGLARSA